METISSVNPLEAHLGYWLRVVSNHVSHNFAARVGRLGVTVAEWVALRELYDGELAPSALAARLGMTRGAITKLADRLRKRRLITRRAHADDGRAQLLSLTPAGRRLVPDLAALADRNDAEFFGALSPDQCAVLEEILKSIVRHHDLRTIAVD